MAHILKAIIVVLGLPRPIASLIIRLTNILDAMVANKTTFVSPPLALATAQAHVAALISAEAAAKTKAIGTAQVRDDALKLAVEDAHQLHAYVQQLANANPVQAANIAAAAAMALRKTPGSKQARPHGQAGHLGGDSRRRRERQGRPLARVGVLAGRREIVAGHPGHHESEHDHHRHHAGDARASTPSQRGQGRLQ